MPRYTHRYSLTAIAAMTFGLAGCGSDDKSLEDFGIETSAPLVCKSPQTINDAGNACELVVSACNFPEVSDPDTGLCIEFTGRWPEEGANGIIMPEPVYTAASRDGGGFDEVVYYYNRPSADFDGWGLHAWNNADCGSYAQFDLAEGGTDWGIPLQPAGVDPNFGLYWIMELAETPNCTNFIPYNFDAGLQTNDLSVDVSSAETNPTGNFFVLARNEADPSNVGTIFPYPRTFASLVVPGGGTTPTVECELPQVPNEDSTECLDPIIGEFTPGEATLYLRGGFNDWGTEENLSDATAFHYEDGVYTATMMIPAAAENGAYEFKIADFDWTDETSFGVAPGTSEERTVVADTPIGLLTGKLATEEDRDVEANIRIVAEQDAMYQFTVNAADPTAPTLTITSSPLATNLYIRGSMNEWGSDEDGNFALATGVSVMRYEGESIYRGRLTLEASEEAYNFKVADAAYAAETNFGASAGDEVIALNTDKSLVSGDDGQNLQFTVSESGTFLLTLDVTDPAAPSLVVRNAIPYDATVYVRGGMNGWGLTDPMTYDGDGIYTKAIPLNAEAYQFKVASEDWATADFGATAGEEDVVLGEGKTMAFSGENIRLAVETAGDYMFHVDANERLAPVLTVRNLDAYAATGLFVRGSMNDWGTTDPMSYIGNGVYQAAVALTAGDYNFKVASEDWATANYGGMPDGETTTIDAGLVATPGDSSGNISITIDADGTYLFSADVTNLTNPTIYVSPQARYGETAVYVRGSMNDWGATDQMTFDGVASYTLDLDLAAGDYAFKVASEDWATVNFGNPGEDQFINLNRNASLIGGEESQNINLTIAEDGAGMYRFDFTIIDPASPILKVSPAPSE